MDHANEDSAAATDPLTILANESEAARRSDGQNQYIKILQEEVQNLKGKIRKLKKDLKEKDEKILELEEEFAWMDDDEIEKKRALKQQQEEEQRRLEEEEREEEEARRKEEESKENMFTETAVWRFFFKFAGFSRYSLLCDEWHECHPTASNVLFGFENWDSAKLAAKEAFPDMDLTPPHIYKMGHEKGNIDLELKECSEFEQAFAIKLMDRTGLTTDRTALLYGKHPRTIRAWKQKWVRGWGLPTYSNEDDDADEQLGNKRKSGTMRPFQSRQMINPTKRKKVQKEPTPNPPIVPPPMLPFNLPPQLQPPPQQQQQHLPPGYPFHML